MKEIIRTIDGLNYNNRKVKEDLMKYFMIKFVEEALFSGKFFWAMSDEKEALKLYGHPEIGWFNSKTEQFRKEHPDALAILRERVIWSSKSENSGKVSFEYMPAKTSHQLLCIEMKLKAEFPNEKNFYLKIGMIPVWNDDYSKIADYVDKPVVDFHD